MDRVTTKRPAAHSQAPTGQPPEAAAPDAGYVHWIYLGAESVFFYPPGSEKEHLVVDHGIPLVDLHWQVKGSSTTMRATIANSGWRRWARSAIWLPPPTPTD